MSLIVKLKLKKPLNKALVKRKATNQKRASTKAKKLATSEAKANYDESGSEDDGSMLRLPPPHGSPEVWSDVSTHSSPLAIKCSSYLKVTAVFQ